MTPGTAPLTRSPGPHAPHPAAAVARPGQRRTAAARRRTGVGAAALDRSTRPAAFQDAPGTALPERLPDTNPRRPPRRVGGLLEGAPE